MQCSFYWLLVFYGKEKLFIWGKDRNELQIFLNHLSHNTKEISLELNLKKTVSMIIDKTQLNIQIMEQKFIK